MVLYHVAQRPGCFIITGACFHPERFRRRDLEVVDIVRIPKRRENRVCEPQHQNILCGFLTEKMIYPIGLFFTERIADDSIELAR